MNELNPGTLVLMVKNADGSFSPIGISREQAYIINAFLSKLSENEPFLAIKGEKYVQAT